VHGATVTDTDGNVIDTTEFFGPASEQQAETEVEETAEEATADAK
jgi:trigger factor